jgi:hypothetical protein
VSVRFARHPRVSRTVDDRAMLNDHVIGLLASSCASPLRTQQENKTVVKQITTSRVAFIFSMR